VILFAVGEEKTGRQRGGKRFVQDDRMCLPGNLPVGLTCPCTLARPKPECTGFFSGSSPSFWTICLHRYQDYQAGFMGGSGQYLDFPVFPAAIFFFTANLFLYIIQTISPYGPRPLADPGRFFQRRSSL
jgi:hypothetical protein